MNTKYCINITKVGTSVQYSCIGEEKIYHIVKFIYCPCGVLYQEPIVQINNSLKVFIFVDGATQINNKLFRSNITTDQNFITLASDIASHHNSNYDSVIHSIHRGIHYLKNHYGQDIEYEGCNSINEPS